jgi:hypothetical protein
LEVICIHSGSQPFGFYAPLECLIGFEKSQSDIPDRSKILYGISFTDSAFILSNPNINAVSLTCCFVADKKSWSSDLMNSWKFPIWFYCLRGL